MIRRGARRSPMIDNREGSGEATAGSGIRNLETGATRPLRSPSGRHSQENQSRAGMLRCPGVRSLADRRGIPHPHGIQRLGDRGEQDSPRRLRNHSSAQDKQGIPRRHVIRRPGVQPQQDIPLRLGIRNSVEQAERGAPHHHDIHRSGDRDKLGIPHPHGIHSSGDRRNREHRNNLGIHTPVMGRADIHRPDNRKEDRRNPDIHRPDNRKEDTRNPDIRRRGNRNKCRAAMVLAREPGRPREPEHSARSAISASSHRLDKG